MSVKKGIGLLNIMLALGCFSYSTAGAMQSPGSSDLITRRKTTLAAGNTVAQLVEMIIDLEGQVTVRDQSSERQGKLLAESRAEAATLRTEHDHAQAALQAQIKAIKNLESTVAVLRLEVDAKKETNGRLKVEKAALAAQVEELQGKVAQSEVIHQALAQRIADRENEIAVLKKQSSELLAAITGYNAQIGILEKNRSDCNQELAAAQAATVAIQAECDRANAQLADVRQQLGTAESRQQAAQTAALASDAALRDQIAALQQELAVARDAQATAVAAMATLQHSHDALEQQLHTVQADFARSQQETTDARAELQRAAVQQATLEGTLAGVRAELSTARAEAMGAESQLRTELASLRAEIVALQENLAAATRSLDAATESFQAQIVDLQRQKSSLETDLVAANTATSHATADNVMIGAQVTNLQGEIARLTTELAEKQRAIASLENEIATKTTAEKDLQRQLEEVRATVTPAAPGVDVEAEISRRLAEAREQFTREREAALADQKAQLEQVHQNTLAERAAKVTELEQVQVQLRHEITKTAKVASETKPAEQTTGVGIQEEAGSQPQAEKLTGKALWMKRAKKGAIGAGVGLTAFFALDAIITEFINMERPANLRRESFITQFWRYVTSRQKTIE